MIPIPLSVLQARHAAALLNFNRHLAAVKRYATECDGYREACDRAVNSSIIVVKLEEQIDEKQNDK